MAKKIPPITSTNLVQFRFPAALLKQLDNLALSHEESRGDCARRLVIEAMTQSWRDDLVEHLQKSDERVQKLRDDIATTLKTLLVACADEDPKRAEDWIREHLLK